MVVAPVVTSLSFWPAGLMLTAKNEPAAKDAVDALSVENGVTAPGAIVPPLLAKRPPNEPVPISVAPCSTVTVETTEPLTSSVPAWTSVAPV